MTVTRAHMNAYFKSGPSRYFDRADKYIELTDRTFGLAQQGAGLGREIALLSGNKASAETCDRVSGAFGDACFALSATRVVFPVERLVTGKMFWERKEDDGTWKADDRGVVPLRDPVSILIEILALSGRVLTAVNWLQAHGAYDMGKGHSKNITHATMAIWAAVIGLDMVQNIRELAKDDLDRGRVKKLAIDTACDGIDLVSLPFDFGYLSFTPELRIAGAAICIIAKGVFIIKELAYD